MCGIAACLAVDLGPQAREDAIARMVARQSHRGPDDRGIASAGPATLGMCRLAIFDPAHGHQPMISPDGRFTLVFNGAIYNYRELRESLRAGWRFQTDCDTEVLLAAFAADGPKCLSRLRGMFAVAVWDNLAGTLFVARDALGIKPLYYVRQPGRVLIASELNGLLASNLVSREIDPAGVADYIAWFSVPAPRTIYRGVSALQPGHSFTVRADGAFVQERWWQLPDAQSARTASVAANYHEFIAGLREKLDDSIRAHRVADVPVGAFLSGGLDSTAIVGLMARGSSRSLKTFSIVFPERDYSEADASRLAAKALGTEHHEELLTGGRVAGDLPRILETFDQPTGDGINTYYASAAARRGGVTVALSGLGGDELFGGYPSFRDLPRLQRVLPFWRILPSNLRQGLIRHLRSRPSTRGRKLADFLAEARDLHELASLQRRVLPEGSRLDLLQGSAHAQALRTGPQHPLLDELVRQLAGADEFQVLSAWELRTYMADVLLRDSDVFSMAHSLELRVPLVDRRLLEWLWPQRAWFKYDSRFLKRALADATADVVPAPIRARAKRGFTLPFARWMRAELKPFLDHTFSKSSLAQCPWLEPAAAAGLWQDYLNGKDDRAWSRVWSVAVLIAFANRRPA